MKKSIIVNKELCEKIEALQYEVESRKEVISQVISTMTNISSSLFAQYQEEFQKYYIEFNKAKAEMLRTYGVKDNVYWNLDFATCELIYED